MTVVLLLALTGMIATPPARAVNEADLLPVDQAFVLSAHASDRSHVEIDWQIAKGYYLYRERMGAVPDAAFAQASLQLPEGIRKHDPFFGDVQIYHDRVVATLTGTPAASAQFVDLAIKYQGCADAGVCYPPQKRNLRVALPAVAAGPVAQAQTKTDLAGAVAKIDGTATAAVSLRALAGAHDPSSGATDAAALPPEQAFGFEAIVDTPNRLLLRFTPAKGYYLYRDKTTVSTAGGNSLVLPGPLQWPAAKAYHDEHFGDVAVYFDPVEVPLPLLRQTADAQSLTVTANFQGCQDNGICYPPMQRSVALALPAGGTVSTMQPIPPGAAPRELPSSTSIWLALLLALGGGLILNLMPCVLPVLSLKALSLVQSGESRARARGHALWYTAGVVLAFAALGGVVIGLRQAGSALGWGFQLQQPLVVAGLAYVMLTVGLALSGVVQLGAGLAGVGQKLTETYGHAGDFFTGVLAVVVASPCTAPFMGGALAFAFAAPATLAMAVFVALGIGLALPFLLIGLVPALASRLPKPGAWMETLKQLLAFPMYLTAAWLISVLASQRGAQGVLYALAGAVALALGLWLWERGRYAKRQHLVRGFAVVAVLLAIMPLPALNRLPTPATAPSQAGIVPYSASKLAELRANGQVVFVDITADWCITCKANERAVLARPAFAAALRTAGAVYMVGDYTNVDAPITAFLGEHHAVGIPLYVVYPRGGGDGEVLPNILTQAIVDGALARASR
ncbi:MAG: protein-disulfide reductase DsbD [Proteobacteria bacterium]|nr:protein-disulfide reductase DsbD [Pseudomonadota bacterium]